MPQFILLLHSDPHRFTELSPEQAQAVVQKYVNWRERLRQEGADQGSARLGDDPGRVVRGATRHA